MERRHPARAYVLIYDKTRILAAVKRVWGERVTTIFPGQGHFAMQEPPGAGRAVDVAIDAVDDLLTLDLLALSRR